MRLRRFQTAFLSTASFCSNRHESTAKKQMTLQAVVYIGFPAPGDKLSLKRSLARSWQHEMKEVTIRPPVLTQGSLFRWNRVDRMVFCNLSGGVALTVWFTTNGMCAKNKNICMWREQAIIEWSCLVIFIVACCHSVKLCTHAARDFRSQQYT